MSGGFSEQDRLDPQDGGFRTKVLRYVRGHPLLTGFVIFEILMLASGLILDIAAPEGKELLNVVGGLLVAYSLILGVLGVILIVGWSAVQRF